MPKNYVLRVLTNEFADTLINTKPTYIIDNIEPRLEQIREAESKMSQIDGDFDIENWFNELDVSKKIQIIKNNPTFLLLDASSNGLVKLKSREVLNEDCIDFLRSTNNNWFNLLNDENIVEKEYDPDSFPSELYEIYNVYQYNEHLFERLFHHSEPEYVIKDNLLTLLNSLIGEEYRSIRTNLVDQLETLMNFIKIVNDFNSVLKEINNKK